MKKRGIRRKGLEIKVGHNNFFRGNIYPEHLPVVTTNDQTSLLAMKTYFYQISQRTRKPHYTPRYYRQ